MNLIMNDYLKNNFFFLPKKFNILLGFILLSIFFSINIYSQVATLPSSHCGPWTTSLPVGWSQFGAAEQTDRDACGTFSAALNASGEYLAVDFGCNQVNSLVYTGVQVSFAGTISIQKSSDNATWTDIQVLNLTTTATQYTIPISGNPRFVRFYMSARTGGRVELDGLNFTGTTVYCTPVSGNNSFSLCSGNLYDVGGASANYTFDCNGYTVLSPSTAGNRIQINGTSSGESCCDYVKVYDGNSNAATLIGTYYMNTSIPTITASNSGGQLTVEFFSDGSIQGAGFNISITCVAAPSAPSNDACSAATSLPCGTSNLAGTTVNSVSETAPLGVSSNFGVWYKFTGDGQQTTISTTAGSGFDHELLIMSGTACGSAYTLITEQDAGLSGGTESYTFTSVNGTQYYVYIAYYSTAGTSSNTGTFTISRSCVAAPTPPSNDACSAATSLPCGTSNLAGTTVNSVSETAPLGVSSNFGVWYTFTGDGQQTTISTTAGSGFDHELLIMSGTACGSAYTQIADQDVGLSGGTESYTFTTVNGTQYYVYIAYWSTAGISTDVGTFTISRSCVAVPPSNDACSAATSLPCGTSNLTGTTVNSVSETAPLSVSSNFGVWYTFTGDGQQTTISTTAGAGFDHELLIMSGTACGSAYTQIADQDVGLTGGTESYTFTTVNGTQYYVYIAYWSTAGTSTDAGTFTISRTCTGPLVNDFCSSAQTLTINSICSNTTANITSSNTASGQTPLPSCYTDFNKEDIWYKFTGNDGLITVKYSPTTEDAVLTVYSGTCGALTEYQCSDRNGSGGSEVIIIENTSSLTTYYVRVENYWGGTMDGSICVWGGPQSNGNSCSTAPTITSVMYSTNQSASAPTAVAPTGTEFGCVSSVDKITYYKINSTGGTVTATFEELNCWYSYGIQVGLFLPSVACNSAVNWNNSIFCTNQLLPNTTNTLTWTGLLANQTYYIIIDAFSSGGLFNSYIDLCSWRLSLTGALPVELVDFKTYCQNNKVKLSWTTQSELNNDYFIIERSTNGILFNEVGRVQGNGTSNQPHEYQFFDEQSLNGISYYRLIQVDFNGQSETHPIIKANCDTDNNELNIYPNPNSGTFEIIGLSDDNLIEITDVLGKKILSFKSVSVNEKINLADVKPGIYFVNVSDKFGKVLTKKIIIEN